MRASFAFDELVVEHRLAEHRALLRVREPGVERGLHQADGARRGLQPPVLEALHLEVEALAEPALAARRGSRPGTNQSSNATS